MRDGHEPGQHWATQDRVIGGLEVSHLEDQILRPEVLLSAEGDRQRDPTQGVGSLPRYNAVEGFVACRHFGEVEIHLLQGFSEDDVQSAPSIDEGLG